MSDDALSGARCGRTCRKHSCGHRTEPRAPPAPQSMRLLDHSAHWRPKSKPESAPVQLHRRPQGSRGTHALTSPRNRSAASSASAPAVTRSPQKRHVMMRSAPAHHATREMQRRRAVKRQHATAAHNSESHDASTTSAPRAVMAVQSRRLPRRTKPREVYARAGREGGRQRAAGMGTSLRRLQRSATCRRSMARSAHSAPHSHVWRVWKTAACLSACTASIAAAVTGHCRTDSTRRWIPTIGAQPLPASSGAEHPIRTQGRGRGRGRGRRCSKETRFGARAVPN